MPILVMLAFVCPESGAIRGELPIKGQPGGPGGKVYFLQYARRRHTRAVTRKVTTTHKTKGTVELELALDKTATTLSVIAMFNTKMIAQQLTQNRCYFG